MVAPEFAVVGVALVCTFGRYVVPLAVQYRNA